MSLVFVSAIVVVCCTLCSGQEFYRYDVTSTPLPFPACRADNIDCLRRGLRTFLFLMNAGYYGMQPIDPMIINSVSVWSPEMQMRISLRRLNVTGASWTQLANRKFNLSGGKSGVEFNSNLHVTGEITVNTEEQINPYTAMITMDIDGAESNVTYNWQGYRALDKEDYIQIGQERIAVRISRTPTFFLQPSLGDTEGVSMIEQLLSMNPSILDHLSNEIATSVMYTMIQNFRLFASKIPVKHYYQYYS